MTTTTIPHATSARAPRPHALRLHAPRLRAPRLDAPRLRAVRHRGPGGRRARATARDRGQVAMEYLGFLPLLLLVALLAVQLGVATYTVNQAGTAARAGARTAASDDARGTGESAARGAVSDWVRGNGFAYREGGGSDVTATVSLVIPSIVPGLGDWEATRSSTMPRE